MGRQGGSADLNAAREIAEIMLHEAGPDTHTPEALAAHRLVAVASLCQANFVAARIHSEKALMIDDSRWDRDVRLRFGRTRVSAAFCYLGLSRWALGEVETARDQIDKAIARAVEFCTCTNTCQHLLLHSYVRFVPRRCEGCPALSEAYS